MALHKRIWQTLMRQKQLDETATRSQLRRCLTTLDLTVVGLGCITGVGVYILTGTVLRDKTGPAGFIAYGIAGLVAMLNAMCYAELGCRIPKAGSAYTFTYIAAGELPAFIIGWSIVQEYLIGAASVARGWSGTLNVLTNGGLQNFTIDIFGEFPKVEYISEYPDVTAGLIILILGGVTLTGAKLSSRFNIGITVINLTVLAFTVITMYIFAKPSQFAPQEHGGFMPYSFTGILQGAATLFYSYIGFDAIVVSVEEALDPVKSIPRALIYTILSITVIKILCAIGLVLFTPWWTLDRTAGFVAAFQTENMVWASWITGVGSILGITAVLLICLISAPRIIYAMASDGLLFGFLGYVWPRTKAPVGASLFLCPLAAITAVLFDIDTLADFISIGTLIAYMMVAYSAISTRYMVPQYLSKMAIDCKDNEGEINDKEEDCNDTEALLNEIESAEHIEGTLLERFKNVPILKDYAPGVACMYALFGFLVFGVAFSVILLVGLPYVETGSWWSILLLCVFLILSLMCMSILAMHKQNTDFDSYKMPLVPYLPCLCIVTNACLIMELSGATWLRFSVWLAIGLFIYFVYGVCHSREKFRNNISPPST